MENVKKIHEPAYTTNPLKSGKPGNQVRWLVEVHRFYKGKWLLTIFKYGRYIIYFL